ncbi:hypothetical protein BH09SUM1_BH09SUM1_17840 [soil metagenome]
MNAIFCTRIRTASLLIFCALLLMSGTARAEGDAAGWFKDIAQADAVRTKEGKPMLLYFFTLQARPAFEMETKTLADPEVAKRLANFACVRIDATEKDDLAKYYRLRKVPTAIFLNAEGKEIDRAVGFKSAEGFIPYLDRIAPPLAAGASNAPTKGGDLGPFKNAAVDISVAGRNTHAVPLKFRAPNAKSVYAVGDFNDWRTDASPMQKGADGDWMLTVNLPDGVYEYLFYADGNYSPDASNKLKKANPYGGMNSLLAIGAYKSSPMVKGNSVFFFVYDAKAMKVDVAGTFNNWKTFTMFRNPKDPGMWGVRYDNLPPGTYSYKYVIDDEWKTDPENYALLIDEEGHQNSSFVIQ